MIGEPVVVVGGAAGGCGASTLAWALALAWTRSGRPTCLLELDVERGDLAGELGVEADRGLDDLLAVSAELDGRHVRQVLYPHPAGPAVIFGTGRREAAGGWDGGALERLLGVIRAERACVVDAGAGPGGPATAAARAANRALVVAPASVAGARRAARMAAALGAARPALVAAPSRCAPGAELSPRALGSASGLELLGALPDSPACAAALGAGRWPGGRRAPLARAVAGIAEALA